jgi:hypothetical protein
MMMMMKLDSALDAGWLHDKIDFVSKQCAAPFLIGGDLARAAHANRGVVSV